MGRLIWFTLLGISFLTPTPASTYTLLGGAVTLDAPSTWHFLRQSADDGDDAVFFHFRVPAMDSMSPDRANVIVRARSLAPATAFTAVTDTVLDNVVHSGAAVVADTTIGGNIRCVLWRGELRGTPYVILDEFGLHRLLL